MRKSTYITHNGARVVAVAFGGSVYYIGYIPTPDRYIYSPALPPSWFHPGNEQLRFYIFLCVQSYKTQAQEWPIKVIEFDNFVKALDFIRLSSVLYINSLASAGMNAQWPSYPSTIQNRCRGCSPSFILFLPIKFTLDVIQLNFLRYIIRKSSGAIKLDDDWIKPDYKDLYLFIRGAGPSWS